MTDMLQYIGTKMLKAKPMTRLAYCEYRGWALPADENGADAGYLVEYLDGGQANHPAHEGYISWSPAEVFSKAYFRTAGLTFGQAIEAARQGLCIHRSGWNGADQFVYRLTGADIAKAFGYGFGEVIGEPAFNDCLVLRNAQNRLVMGWVPSTGDLLAIDWSIKA